MQRAPARLESPQDDEFGALLADEAARLGRYARRLTGSGADADDLLQDTMLRCWTARHTFRPGTNFAAWARTVMRNSFLTARRRARFHADLPDEAMDRMLSVAATQAEAVDLRDVDWAMGELTPEHRAAVQLATQGLPIDEAAALLSISPGTFKSRVWRARARLKSLTEDRTTPLLSRAVKPDPSPEKPRARRNWKGVMIG